MKGWLKCRKKRAFSDRRAAEGVVLKNFLNNREAYGIYECPLCLEFHLTSKYDNRTHQLKKHCFLEAVGGYRRSTHNLIKKRMAQMYSMLPAGTKPKIKSIKGTKKENTLSLAEQHRILATLNN